MLLGVQVLVAGGRGFIGRHVCEWLTREGHHVRVSGRGEPLIGGDVIIHLGLFDARTAREVASQLQGRPLVVASSGDVYFAYDQMRGREPWDGVQPGPLGEDAPLRVQMYPYGRMVSTPKRTLVDYEKIHVEREVAPATVLRLPKVWGPGAPPPPFAAEIRRVREGERAVLGERLAGWRWTHGYVDDVAHAIGLAATLPQARGRTYNVGEASPRTTLERLRSFVGEVDIVPDDDVPPELRLPLANPVDLVFDTSRIRRELGYHEQVDLETAIECTLDAAGNR